MVSQFEALKSLILPGKQAGPGEGEVEAAGAKLTRSKRLGAMRQAASDKEKKAPEGEKSSRSSHRSSIAGALHGGASELDLSTMMRCASWTACDQVAAPQTLLPPLVPTPVRFAPSVRCGAAPNESQRRQTR